MEHPHALHDGQILGIGCLDFLGKLVMVGTLAGFELAGRVVLLERLHRGDLCTHRLHHLVGHLLHTHVETLLQLFLQYGGILLREHDDVAVHHLVLVHLQEQRGAFLDVPFILRRLQPLLDALCQIFVDHNLLLISVKKTRFL